MLFRLVVVDDRGTYVLTDLLMGEVTVDWLRVCELSRRFDGGGGLPPAGRIPSGGGGPILEFGRLLSNAEAAREGDRIGLSEV